MMVAMESSATPALKSTYELVQRLLLMGKTQFHISATTHPSLSLPCGTDRAGMPFGLQIVGRFRADRHTLGVAHAMEQAFNGIEALRRPVPDVGRLRRAEPALDSIVTAPPLHGATSTGSASAV
jgi:Asp-tRNA(Asn)/Glu-tRNA(Gln) amidotransferase A subunit family amidase